MLVSIQDYLKKINRSLTLVDCISLLATTLVIIGLVLYFTEVRKKEEKEVVYTKGVTPDDQNGESLPFASRNGKTYTFSWCGGASAIKPANKIYFKTETEAQNSGRTLSKLCGK